MPTPDGGKGYRYPKPRRITAMLMAIWAMGPSRGREQEGQQHSGCDHQNQCHDSGLLGKDLVVQGSAAHGDDHMDIPVAKVAVATVLSAYSSVAAMSVTSAG